MEQLISSCEEFQQEMSDDIDRRLERMMASYGPKTLHGMSGAAQMFERLFLPERSDLISRAAENLWRSRRNREALTHQGIPAHKSTMWLDRAAYFRRQIHG